MKIPLLTFLFLWALLPLAQGQILRYTYEDDEEQNVWFEEEIRFIVDSIGELTIADVLADSNLVVVDPRQVEMPDTIYYLWTSVELSNQSTVFRNEFFVTLWDIDSMWVYTTVGDQVTNLQITGEGVSSWNKHSPSVKNMTPLNLLPGETKTFWLRFRIRVPSTKHFLHRLFRIQPIAPINKYITINFVWQSFYLGFMVLFCLLSLYMYRLFWDRIFLYFGGLMLSFGCYFMILSRVSDAFLLVYFPNSQYLFQNWAISGIVFCFSFFIVNYLDLSQRYRRYVRIAITYIVLMETFAHLAPFIIDHNVMVICHNKMLLLWVVLCFLPIGVTAWRKEPKGKMLLRTVMILFVASGAHLLQINRVQPGTGSAFSVFQFGTMVFAAVLFYDLFTRIDTIRREKDRFQELDQLKSRFFANISHEFRTPLTLIMGPLNQLKEKQPDAEDRKLMGLMHRNAERLLNLINQILDLSKLEAGKMKLDLQQVNFPALLKGIVMSFESLAEQQGVRLHFASEVDELALAVDPNKMEQIFNNLLSNAFKFTKVSEEVSVLLTVKEDWVTVFVKDTGRGIPADQLPHIFNRFFQADEAKTEDVPGTGIGLTLVKELVHLHGGTIDVRSIENKRTSFRLRFPVVISPAGEQTGEEVFMSTSSSFTFPDKEVIPATDYKLPFLPLDRHSSTTPLVLIIEDHEDVRFYIKQNLRQHYRLLEAPDGQDGIDKALEYQPDLIISDVMMPKKNGYEVCRTLKNDQRTSHIPLILLTAKASREEKLHGLEEGADDYLLKPFDTEELQLRVRNLIASRQQLRQQFTEPAEQAIIDPQLNATDRAFLEQVYAVLDTHLDNEQFSVDVLAEEIGMSRRHLNRKLSALTDLSANPFIRNYRLQKALLMLQRQEGNVSEVALATGFSSTAYFVKCFREKFGQTPGSM
jgi:signal transduction histidine kinase/DNA-binding response OmpR family regulator